MRPLRAIGLLLLMLFGLTGLLVLSGCDREAGTKDEHTVTTPGGQTTVTDETTVEKSGDHRADPGSGRPGPPPAPDNPPPPDNPTDSGQPGPRPADPGGGAASGATALDTRDRA